MNVPSFNKFSQPYRKEGVGLRSAVAKALRRYRRTYSFDRSKIYSLDEKYEHIFAEIEAATDCRLLLRPEHPYGEAGDDKIMPLPDEGIIPSTYETLVKNWARGEGDRNDKAMLVFYYFKHFVPDDPSFAEDIEMALAQGSATRPVPESSGSDIVTTADRSTSRSSEVDPPLWLPEPEFLNSELSNWLSPLVEDALPFVGRTKELRQLTEFAESAQPFQVWALSGPSGAGKTRLVTHWMRQFNQSNNDTNSPGNWQIGFLDRDAIELWKDGWEHWIPQRPTFLAIDYIYHSHPIINGLIKRSRQFGQNGSSHPVRLLLIDHVFPVSLDEMFKNAWFSEMSSGGADWQSKQRLFFSDHPMMLMPDAHSGDYLSNIMSASASIFGHTLHETQLDEGLDDIKRTSGAWCPLFAALKGYSFAQDKKSQFGDRRQLISFYLNTTNRLPWYADNANDKALGLMSGYFVAIATIMRGVPFDALVAALPEKKFQDADADEQLAKIIARCCWIVSNSDRRQLSAFEPDILGESFFLEFYDHLKAPINRTAPFVEFLSRVSLGVDGDVKAEEFIEFFERMTRNLENDNQDDPKIVDYWSMFLDFLDRNDFPDNTPIQQAVSITLTRVIQSLIRCGHTQLAAQCLPR